MSKNILFLADPNSIHDIKWMTFFSDKYRCYLLARESHLKNWSEERVQIFFDDFNIQIVSSIPDYSSVWFWKNKQGGKLLNGLIDKYDINVFHIMYAEPNALWVLPLKNTRKIKKILTTRGTDILKTIPAFFSRKSPLNMIIKYNYKKAFSSFDNIAVTSENQKSVIKQLVKIKDQISIIRTGVDWIDYNKIDGKELLIKYGINKPYIFFPRVMRPIYNHEFALQCINQLPREILHSYEFVFVGLDGSDQGYIGKIMDMMNGAEYFKFLPFMSQKELLQMYKETSATIMTPYSDGSPVSAMEAVMMGSPVVLPELNYDKEIFQNKGIHFYKPGNHESLMHHILKIVENTLERPIPLEFKNKISRSGEMEKLEKIYNS